MPHLTVGGQCGKRGQPMGFGALRGEDTGHINVLGLLFQKSVHSDRQHPSCVSYKPSRRNQVTEVPKGSPETVETDSSMIGLLEADASPRGPIFCVQSGY